MKYEPYVANENKYKPEPLKRMVRCPACRREVPFEGNPHRPFCSRGCKGIDLISWANESYRVEGRPDKDKQDDEPD
jgi:uncharacterized protein